MDSDLQKKISGANSALTEIKNAINSEENEICFVRHSLSNFQNGYGGRGARNIYNNINEMSRELTNILNGLKNTSNIISTENNSLKQDVK